jgi:hypothetical protein
MATDAMARRGSGGAVGTALLNTIFAGAAAGYLATSGDAGRAAVHGYHVGFWTGAGILAAGALLAVGLITTTRRATTPGAPGSDDLARVG